MTYTTLRILLTSLLIAGATANGANAQVTVQYYRLYLHDKGTPARVLIPTDSLYGEASAHLTPRALARRAKVLPADSLVSTDDLPLVPSYLEAIRATGAEIVQTSRWLNSAMVRTDSVTFEALQRLPFLDSARAARTFRRREILPIGKRPATEGDTATAEVDPATLPWCITDRYGKARLQNTFMGIDKAHRYGFAGEGVLIGVLDAGFKWREHLALRNLNVIAEHDFVYNDDNTADEPGEVVSQGHGTVVLSMIAGGWDGVLIGGAPHASYALARTEDIRSERNVEEDHFVAGLEWLESLGVDITNTSLGYTTFDAPEKAHFYETLDGHTAFASRGVNHAVGLGVICVLAAGNEGANSFKYVSVPAEADSAIAAAAIDSNGNVAKFSSRGFDHIERIKPDVAGLGVANWGADHASSTGLVTGQGTSYASPMVTASTALILSARPWLRPWEVRDILFKTSSKPDFPDTAVGHGRVNVGDALTYMARTGPIVGMPRAYIRNDSLVLYWWSSFTRYSAKLDHGGTDLLIVTVGSSRTGFSASQGTIIAPTGLMTMVVPIRAGTAPAVGDTISLDMKFFDNGIYYPVRNGCLRIENERELLHAPPHDVCTSTLCYTKAIASIGIATAVPNPTSGITSIGFQLAEESTVSLSIYNTLGERVASLVENRLYAPGFHSVLWNPDGIPDGAYYYLLRVNDQSYSNSVTLLRNGK